MQVSSGPYKPPTVEFAFTEALETVPIVIEDDLVARGGDGDLVAPARAEPVFEVPACRGGDPLVQKLQASARENFSPVTLNIWITLKSNARPDLGIRFMDKNNRGETTRLKFLFDRAAV